MPRQRLKEAAQSLSPLAETAVAATSAVIDPTRSSQHQLEAEVQRQLLSHPGLRFSSLVIRRIPKGVCLEGVLEAEEQSPDVSSVAKQVTGVDEVRNHLVVRQPVGAN